MKAGLRLILAVLLLAGAAYGIYRWRQAAPQDLTASGTLEASEIQLASRLAGRVLSIPVKEGQNVRPGQVLLSLDTAELQAQLRQTRAQQRAAQAQLELVRAGARREDLMAAEAAVTAAELRTRELLNGSLPAERERAAAEVASRNSALELARTELQRLEKLSADGAATPQMLDQARATVTQARSAWEAARQSQRLIDAGPRSEDIGIARQQARQQQAQLERLRHGPRSQEIAAAAAQRDQVAALADQLTIRLADGRLQAPCACRISLIGTEAGELASAGAPLITLLDPEDLWVKVYLSPLELSRVKLNQPVSLHADAWPERSFPGRVVYVSPTAEFTPRNIQTREERNHQVFAVKVALVHPDGKLFAGMPVDVSWSPQP